MFINLTNHPSTSWSLEQLDAAAHYGEVVDVGFPVVLPTATTADVHRLADGLVKELLQMCEDAGGVVVHVMGEHTLTYSIVARLQARGIVCLASTTERNAIMTPDGKKISEFKFVQFREY